MTGKAKRPSLMEKFARPSFAYIYAEGLVKGKLADQFRHFRGDMTQGQFAEILGTQQPKISERFENPDYGKHNLSTLLDAARSLGLMLDVELKSADTFYRDNHNPARDWFDLLEFDQAVKRLERPAAPWVAEGRDLKPSDSGERFTAESNSTAGNGMAKIVLMGSERESNPQKTAGEPEANGVPQGINCGVPAASG